MAAFANNLQIAAYRNLCRVNTEVTKIDLESEQLVRLTGPM